MLRTLTINLIKCRRIEFAESFISKYKFGSLSKTHQPKNLSPITVNGQYLAENIDNINFVKISYLIVSSSPIIIWLIVIVYNQLFYDHIKMNMF